jgi:histo-blood group ABO system transferase
MEGEPKSVDLTKLNFARLANNYLNKVRLGEYSVDELNSHNDYVNYVTSEQNQNLPVYNVGVLMVCINSQYWQYAYPVIDGIRKFFLPGHNTEIMMWSDMPQYPESKDVTYGTTVFPTESVGWPYPTLMRYHMFLEQEEYLKKFDYLFYVDLDMRVVNIVGDEILGDGLTGAEHPMYAFKPGLRFPLEPNPTSSAYVPVPNNYFAGGFQGGKTDMFIDAMKSMKENIDSDMEKEYIARWNDESHWNRYLYQNAPSVVLNPSYVYPDSLINEYYKPLWGRDYTPKIITLTKPFTTSKEGGEAVQKMLNQGQI